MIILPLIPVTLTLYCFICCHLQDKKESCKNNQIALMKSENKKLAKKGRKVRWGYCRCVPSFSLTKENYCKPTPFKGPTIELVFTGSMGANGLNVMTGKKGSN